MKSLILLAICLCLSFDEYAQEMEGNWYGWLEVGENVLPLEIHCIHPTDGPFELYSKQQTSKAIPLQSWSVEKGVWQWESKKLGASYRGEWMEEGQKFKGVLIQRGMSMPLDFGKKNERDGVEPKKVSIFKRPQTPQPPFDYSTEELVMLSKTTTGDDIQLHGTLSLPKGKAPFPCLIMITGSGPQDRDETILGHKPFAIISDTLAKLGWASFRFDERGVGESTGDFEGATSLDFAQDASAIFSQLKRHNQLDPSRIGLLGHSEGSLVAAMVAAEKQDVACIVSMAGPGVRGLELLQKQSFDIQVSSGKSSEDAQQDVDFNTRIMNYIVEANDSLKIAQFIKENVVNPDDSPASEEDSKLEGKEIFEYYNTSFNNAWMRYFIQHNPSEDWRNVHCPVLILNGDKDLQVNASVNTQAIYGALPFHIHTEMTILSNHNHLFQYTENGGLSEYGTLEESLSLETVEVIADWLKKLH